MEKEVFRVEEFCIRYAISRREFYREIAAHKLSIIKRGRRTLVARTDAESWLEAQRKRN